MENPQPRTVEIPQLILGTLARAGGVVMIVEYLLIPVTIVIATLIGIQISFGVPNIVVNLPYFPLRQRVLALVILAPCTLLVLGLMVTSIIITAVIALYLSELAR